MVYIYDILLNFNEGIPYEFFEWQKEDEIDHIKKIPLYKLHRKAMQALFYEKIQVPSSFLNELKEKTELYRKGMVEKASSLALFTDGTIALAVEFDENGISLCKSRLLLDEEEEVLETSRILKEIPFSYSCIEKYPFSFQTRYERQMSHFLKQEFQVAIEEKNLEKIAYFYEECFDEIFSNLEESGKQLLESLSHLNASHKKLYTLLLRSYQLRK